MNKRRILKTTSWRVIGTVLTGTTAYIVTGNLPLATGAALVDAVIKYVAYYYHEVLWDMKKEKEDVEEIVKDITAAKSRRPAPRPDKCCRKLSHRHRRRRYRQRR